jgi:NAD(P)-dependent dehydrogenase (short-subunit alcohol dehydrogenase family)
MTEGQGKLMNLFFENKVALVTGTAAGMVLATAKAFAETGAAVVLWLSSPGASYLVGQAITLDGGMTVG